MRRAIRARRGHAAFGRGRPVVLESDRPEVFAHACVCGEAERGLPPVLAVHNLSGRDVTVRVDVSGVAGEGVVAVFPDPREVEVREGEMEIELGGWGYLWLRRAGEGSGPTGPTRP